MKERYFCIALNSEISHILYSIRIIIKSIRTYSISKSAREREFYRGKRKIYLMFLTLLHTIFQKYFNIKEIVHVQCSFLQKA